MKARLGFFFSAVAGGVAHADRAVGTLGAAAAAVALASLAPADAYARSLKKELASALADPARYPVALEVFGKTTSVETYDAPQAGPMETPDFSVVRGTGDEVLDWSVARGTLDAPATNLYFHSLRAITYFRELAVRAEPLIGDVLRTTSSEELPVVVRIGVAQSFSMTRKFSKMPDYNNARTIPDGDFTEPLGFPFETEIWFHAPKRVYRQDWLGALGSKLPGLRNSKLITQQAPSDYALVPSVVYHEWTHLFTKPWIGVTRDFEINEGVANYFGSVIAGQPRMGVTPGLTPKFYEELRFDRDPGVARAGADQAECCDVFVPKLLWAIRDALSPRPLGQQAADRAEVVGTGDLIAIAAVTRLQPGEGYGALKSALLEAVDRALAVSLITNEERDRVAALVQKHLGNF